VLKHSGYTLPELAEKFCKRRFSVGSDGILLIEESNKGDFKMRILNPDGSEVDMCGNGSRCVALYAVENGIAGKTMEIETRAGVIRAEVVGLSVKLALTNPKDLKLDLSLTIGKKRHKIHSINTGVPHVVSFVKNLEKVNVARLGSKIRHHREFGPEGANVDFVKVKGPREIVIRTYERGVEGETYACGTGAAASAVISGLIHGMAPHVDVHTVSGETLRVYFDIKGNGIRNVYLEGEARVIYKGVLSHV